MQNPHKSCQAEYRIIPFGLARVSKISEQESLIATICARVSGWKKARRLGWISGPTDNGVWAKTVDVFQYRELSHIDLFCGTADDGLRGHVGSESATMGNSRSEE